MTHAVETETVETEATVTEESNVPASLKPKREPVTVKPAPQSLTDSEDGMVAILWERKLFPLWQDAYQASKVLVTARDTEEKVDEWVETSEDESAAKFRKAREHFEAQKAKAEEALAKLEATVEAFYREAVVAGSADLLDNLDTEQASKDYTAAMKAFNNYVNDDVAFPEVKAAAAGYELPTTRSLVSGRKGSARQEGTAIRLAVAIRIDGVQYDNVGSAAKSAKIPDNQALAEAIITAAGGRESIPSDRWLSFPYGEHTVEVRAKADKRKLTKADKESETDSE